MLVLWIPLSPASCMGAAKEQWGKTVHSEPQLCSLPSSQTLNDLDQET